MISCFFFMQLHESHASAAKLKPNTTAMPKGRRHLTRMVDASGDICEHASKGTGTVRAAHHTWGSAIGTGHFASLRLSEPTKRNVGDKERTGGRAWASEALTFVADAGSYVPASNLASRASLSGA